MPGHPDGQNYAIWRAALFAASANTQVDLTHPFHAQGQTTNYASLGVNVTPETGTGVTVAVKYWTDLTQSQLLAQFIWNVPVGMTLQCILPNLSNFMTLDVTSASAGGGLVNIQVYPTNTPATRIMYPVAGNRVFNLAQSIPAGQTFISPLPYLVAGEGHVFAKDINASAKLTIQVVELNLDNTRNNVIFEADAPITVVQADFATVDVPVGLEVINTDGAAAHTIGYHLAIESSL